MTELIKTKQWKDAPVLVMRESLSLGSNFFLLGDDFLFLVGIPSDEGVRGLFIEKIRPHYLSSNFDFNFLLGLNLIWLDLRLNVTSKFLLIYNFPLT